MVAMGGKKTFFPGLVLWLLCGFCSAHYNNNWTYTKYHAGRHVCSSQRDVNKHAKLVQAHPKTLFKPYSQRCHNNQICQGVRVVYETVPKEVHGSKTTPTTFVCCPGWIQHSKISYGCKKPFCKQPCANGGVCSGPQTCSCRSGFSGKFCQDDVNECTVNKPCDHFCFNTIGSFYCKCKDSFVLQPDNQSCKRDTEERTAFEVEDLGFDMLDRRIHKLEKMMETEVYSNSGVNVLEMSSKLNDVITKLQKLENKFQDLTRLTGPNRRLF